MKKIFIGLLVLSCTGYSAAAQYYYDDIVNNKQVLKELAALKEKKVKGVKVVSLEADGTESEGFTCQKKVNRDFTEVEIYTETNESYPNTFTSYFDGNGLLKQTVDSSEAGVTSIGYTYDAAGRLVSVNSTKNFATDDDAGVVLEKHLYTYNTAGVLQQMLLIKNNKDSTRYLFEADESGNVIIEKNTRTAEVFYYYYDARNQLTDVVHSYARNTKMLTEYTFEYNDAGQVVSMVSSEKDGADYFTWRYTYEDGLRTSERCYSKAGRIMGSVEYKYK